MSGEETSLDSRWRSFYRERCAGAIGDLARGYPDERSLYVDVITLHQHDPSLAEALFADPERVLRRAAGVLRDAHDRFERVNVRLTNHPGLLGIRSIRSRHVGELVSIHGVVTDAGTVQAKVDDPVYGCDRCGTRTGGSAVGQRLVAPRQCPRCDAPGPFTLRPEAGSLVDVQRLRVAELPGADDPRSVDVCVDDDLVDGAEPDDALQVTGIVRLDWAEETNRHDFYLDGVSVEEGPAGGRADAEADSSSEVQDLINSRWRSLPDR